MTAPTHPEPRPDDEGRETAATTAPPRQHSYASMSFRGSFPRFVCTQCGVASTDARANEPCGRIAPPVAPHPAPLGATDEPTLASQYAKVCAEHEEATRAMSSRIVYVGATDEGLLTAIREHCRVVYYPPNAEYPIEHAPLAGKDSWDELRAALQAGPR